jgi:predicted O-methyltransferase YrrM
VRELAQAVQTEADMASVRVAAVPLRDLETTFSERMFTHGNEWVRYLQPFVGRPVTYLEVGSFVGESVVWMLENVLTHPLARALCLDPWEPYTDNDTEVIPSLEMFERNTEPWRAKIVAMRGRSDSRLAEIPFDTADIAYVDGDHHQWSALEDLVLVWPRLKVGGVLIIDDFGTDEAKPTFPKAGVEAFVKVYGPKLQILHVGWQVIVRKTA